VSVADDERFREASRLLADGVVAAVPAWVERRVVELHDTWAGSTPTAVADRARAAGEAAAASLRERLDALFALDVDGQRSNPLHLVREEVVGGATAVLDGAGVPEVVRDADAERIFPADVYDLTPGSFAELDPDLHEIGLVWGATKAKAHLARRSRS
jgi:hypothetical protein